MASTWQIEFQQRFKASILHKILIILDSSYSVGKKLDYLNSLQKVTWLSVCSN